MLASLTSRFETEEANLFPLTLRCDTRSRESSRKYSAKRGSKKRNGNKPVEQSYFSEADSRSTNEEILLFYVT